jgi:hypothetical protein
VNGLEWGLNIAVIFIVAALITAKWSVFKMVQQVNKSAEPTDRVSFKWWANYQDRRVARLYHSVFPRGRWNLIYAGSLASAFLLFLLAVFAGSHLVR